MFLTVSLLNVSTAGVFTQPLDSAINSFCSLKRFFTLFAVQNYLLDTSVTLRCTGGHNSHSCCRDRKRHRVSNTSCTCSRSNMDIVFVARGRQEVGDSSFSPGNLIQTTMLLSMLTRNVPLWCYPSAADSSLIPQYYTKQKLQ